MHPLVTPVWRSTSQVLWQQWHRRSPPTSQMPPLFGSPGFMPQMATLAQSLLDVQWPVPEEPAPLDEPALPELPPDEPPLPPLPEEPPVAGGANVIPTGIGAPITGVHPAPPPEARALTGSTPGSLHETG